MKIRKFNDLEKLNEDVSENEIREQFKSIWKHYPNIKLITRNNRFVITNNGEEVEYLSTNADQLGLDIVNCYLSGIISGLLIAGKDVDYPPKKINRKISKIDPYGEEDWEN